MTALRSHRTKTLWMAALVGVTLTSLLAASTAANGATAAKGDTYYTPPTPYHNIGNYDPGCSNVNVKAHYDYEGVYSDKNATGTHGQAFFHKDETTYTQTWKLRSTGEVLLTQSGNVVFEEIKATFVPKSEVPKRLIPKKGLVGPVYRFTATQTGDETVRDADGKTLVASYGTVTFKQLFDTKGDSKPGGRELSLRVANVSGPHPPMNLCKLSSQIVS